MWGQGRSLNQGKSRSRRKKKRLREVRKGRELKEEVSTSSGDRGGQRAEGKAQKRGKGEEEKPWESERG